MSAGTVFKKKNVVTAHWCFSWKQFICQFEHEPSHKCQGNLQNLRCFYSLLWRNQVLSLEFHFTSCLCYRGNLNNGVDFIFFDSWLKNNSWWAMDWEIVLGKNLNVCLVTCCFLLCDTIRLVLYPQTSINSPTAYWIQTVTPYQFKAGVHYYL